MSALGLWPCSPGCEASDSDVRYCDCRCRGVNHGRLLPGRYHEARPFYAVPSGHVIRDYSMLPEDRNIPIARIAPQLALPLPTVHYPAKEPSRLSPSSRSAGLPVTSKKTRLGRSIAKHAFGHVTQAEHNESILRGIRSQFNQENTDAAITQAYSIFFERMGSDQNRPELYELFENGDIDKALAYFGKSWVIGRPKKRPQN